MGGYTVQHDPNHDPTSNLVDEVVGQLNRMTINDNVQRNEENGTARYLLPVHPNNRRFRRRWGSYRHRAIPRSARTWDPFHANRFRTRRTAAQWWSIDLSRASNNDIVIEMGDDDESDDEWVFDSQWHENLHKEQKKNPVSKEDQKKWPKQKWIALFEFAKSRQSKRRFKWTYY